MDKYRKTRNRQRKRYYSKTQNAINSGKPWTEEDDAVVLKHEVSDTEISQLLHRSVGSIQSRRYILTHK